MSRPVDYLVFWESLLDAQVQIRTGTTAERRVRKWRRARRRAYQGWAQAQRLVAIEVLGDRLRQLRALEVASEYERP